MKRKAWWLNPQTIISCLIGGATILGWFVTERVSDARQQDRIEDLQEEVDANQATDKQQEEQIEQTERQYMLIQQSLGGIQESLKEMKRQSR